MGKIQRVIPAFVIFLFGITLLFVFIPSHIKVLENSSAVNARFFPYLLSVMIIVFSGIDLIASLLKSPSLTDDQNQEEQEVRNENKNVHIFKYGRVVLAFLSCVLWTLMSPYVGYIVTTIVVVGLLMLIFGNRSWIQILLTSIIFSILSFYVFANILNISLPKGILL